MREKEKQDSKKSEENVKNIKDVRTRQREEIGQIISEEIPREVDKEEKRTNIDKS